MRTDKQAAAACGAPTLAVGNLKWRLSMLLIGSCRATVCCFDCEILIPGPESKSHHSNGRIPELNPPPCRKRAVLCFSGVSVTSHSVSSCSLHLYLCALHVAVLQVGFRAKTLTGNLPLLVYKAQTSTIQSLFKKKQSTPHDRLGLAVSLRIQHFRRPGHTSYPLFLFAFLKHNCKMLFSLCSTVVSN